MTALPAPDRRLAERRISPAISEFAIQECARLREELLQCRSKLALAAESATGDGELIAELLAALQALVEHGTDSPQHLAAEAALSHATQPRPDQSEGNHAGPLGAI